MSRLDIKVTNEELGELLFRRLELKYEGQLKALGKKFTDFENLVFSWQKQTQKELDALKSFVKSTLSAPEESKQ